MRMQEWGGGNSMQGQLLPCFIEPFFGFIDEQ